MAELDYITVEGFKSIKSIQELKLGQMTVLIGPNGSGKSNFLGVFSFLNAIREGRLHEYVIKAGGADKVLHFGSRVTGQLHIRISFRDGVNQYRIELEPNGSDELFPQAEVVYFWDKGEAPLALRTARRKRGARSRNKQAKHSQGLHTMSSGTSIAGVSITSTIPASALP